MNEKCTKETTHKRQLVSHNIQHNTRKIALDNTKLILIILNDDEYKIITDVIVDVTAFIRGALCDEMKADHRHNNKYE